MDEPVRVVVAGHTGLEKARAIASLRDCLEAEYPRVKNRVGIYDVEEAVRETGGGDPRLLAGVRSARVQRQRWRAAWDLIQSQIATAGDLCSIVSLHLVFAQRGHRVCPAPLSVVADWQAHVVVTLIDDVYAVKRRIQLRNYSFSFSQLYEWRTAEIMLADQIACMCSLRSQKANGPGGRGPLAACDSLVVAVKQPVRTLSRLLIDRGHPRAYMSFPITSTRGDADRRREVNRFRQHMHELFVAFDPLTIEELPLVLQDGRRAEGRTSYHPTLNADNTTKNLSDQRWDSRLDVLAGSGLAPLVWEPDSAQDHTGNAVPFYPVTFEERELDDLWSDEGGSEVCLVHDHVTTRDLRLVDQSDFVVCYRPYWDGRLSGGVGAEIRHANETGKPVYAFVAEDLRGAKPLEGSLTHQFVIEDKFWKFLEHEATVPRRVPRPTYY